MVLTTIYAIAAVAWAICCVKTYRVVKKWHLNIEDNSPAGWQKGEYWTKGGVAFTAMMSLWGPLSLCTAWCIYGNLKYDD